MTTVAAHHHHIRHGRRVMTDPRSKVWRDTYANALAKGATDEQARRLADAVLKAWQRQPHPDTGQRCYCVDEPHSIDDHATPDTGDER